MTETDQLRLVVDRGQLEAVARDLHSIADLRRDRLVLITQLLVAERAILTLATHEVRVHGCFANGEVRQVKAPGCICVLCSIERTLVACGVHRS
jgi:hypothetical protein